MVQDALRCAIARPLPTARPDLVEHGVRRVQGVGAEDLPGQAMSGTPRLSIEWTVLARCARITRWTVFLLLTASRAPVDVSCIWRAG